MNYPRYTQVGCIFFKEPLKERRLLYFIWKNMQILPENSRIYFCEKKWVSSTQN